MQSNLGSPSSAPGTDIPPLVFALGGSESLGLDVCHLLGTALAPHELRAFEDGEHKSRPLISVRDRDVYVVDSLNGEEGQSPNDKLCRLLFFVGALKDSSAGRVTAVVPYLCYSRKDRKTKPRDPVTTRYVAQLLEAVGTDRVITLEAHNVAAFQNAFRCHTEHLHANGLFADYFVELLGGAEVAVISPDPGGVKRAESFRQRLERQLGRPVGGGFMEKHRSLGVVTGELFAGDVRGREVIVIDDLISTGGTMARAAVACQSHGARAIHLAATHALFATDWESALRAAPVDQIVVTNSVKFTPRGSETADGRVVVLSIATLLAETVRRCHSGESLTELLEGDVSH